MSEPPYRWQQFWDTKGSRSRQAKLSDEEAITLQRMYQQYEEGILSREEYNKYADTLPITRNHAWSVGRKRNWSHLNES